MSQAGAEDRAVGLQHEVGGQAKLACATRGCPRRVILGEGAQPGSALRTAGYDCSVAMTPMAASCTS